MRGSNEPGVLGLPDPEQDRARQRVRDLPVRGRSRDDLGSAQPAGREHRPGSASGNGIYSDQGALGITVRANSFRNHINAGILFATAGTQQESIIIQNNRSLNDNMFVALFNVQNAQIVANQTNDDTTPMTSGPRSSSGVRPTGSSSSGTSL